MNRGGRLAAAILIAATGGVAAAASFDCGQARLRAEKLICADPALSALDGRLAAAYRAVLEGAEPRFAGYARLSQRQWLRARNATDEKACADAPCLRQLYEERLRQITRPYYRHEGLYEKAGGKRRETLLVTAAPDDLAFHFAAADDPRVSPSLKAGGNAPVSAAGEARWQSGGCTYTVKLEADRAVVAERGQCAQGAAGTYVRRFDRLADPFEYQ